MPYRPVPNYDGAAAVVLPGQPTRPCRGRYVHQRRVHRRVCLGLQPLGVTRLRHHCITRRPGLLGTPWRSPDRPGSRQGPASTGSRSSGRGFAGVHLPHQHSAECTDGGRSPWAARRWERAHRGLRRTVAAAFSISLGPARARGAHYGSLVRLHGSVAGSLSPTFFSAPARPGSSPVHHGRKARRREHPRHRRLRGSTTAFPTALPGCGVSPAARIGDCTTSGF